MGNIRKWHVMIVLSMILCMIPLFTALATSGTITATSLNMRAKASTESNVVGVLHQGDKTVDTLAKIRIPNRDKDPLRLS